MQFPFRIRLRSLLLLIAGVALVGGGWIEVENHRLRDRFAQSETVLNQLAGRHERELAACRAAQVSGLPYDRSRAQWSRQGTGARFTTWDLEATWHEKYAEAERAESRRQGEFRQQAQHRLLWPY